MTFNECEAMRKRKLATATYLERIDADTFGVKYHNTFVVKIHRDGTYTLDSGGWRTSTTKRRMNQYTPFRVSQTKGKWSVGPLVYRDGMRIGEIC